MILFGLRKTISFETRYENQTADYAIIGGSGLYGLDFLDQPYSTSFKTKEYGPTSSPVVFGKLGDNRIIFLPRHGKDHNLYPHQVPYASNMMLLKKLGVKFIIATSIVGSLSLGIRPGMMVIPDQFVNFTNRDDKQTMGNSRIIHTPMGEPYCNQLRNLISSACSRQELLFTDKATVAVIDGPRFNTRAESSMQQSSGCDIVNMTQYPEAYYARLAGMCYANLAAVTDYDVCIDGSLNFSKGNFSKVLEVFKENIKKQKQLLHDILLNLSSLDCCCAKENLKPFFES